MPTPTPPTNFAKPFLKWVGGKGQLLAQFEPLFPPTFARYIEPFVGGGAVFFHLWNTRRLRGPVLLFDHNAELVNAYRVVRDRVEELIAALAVHESQHSKAHYYTVRAWDRQDMPLDDVVRAARTLYLNRTCYNGLYRVNSKGQFNVPIGRHKNLRILYPGVLRTASAALQMAQIEVADFRAVAGIARSGDFVYFDPPYVPVSRTANFTSYTAGDFGDDDQAALAAVFAQLSARGCHCMLSNSYTPRVRELYADFAIHKVQANRAVNANASRRGAVSEAVVTSWRAG